MKGVSEVVAVILMLMITIALAGMAFMYISGIFTAKTQGIEVADSYCAGGTVTFTIRNLGTTNVTSISCTRTAPAGECSFTGVNIAPGTTQSFTDACPGTGGRSCVYRLTPSVGTSIQANVYCV